MKSTGEDRNSNVPSTEPGTQLVCNVSVLIKKGQGSTLKRGKERMGMVIWAEVDAQNVLAASRYYYFAFKDFSSMGSESEPALT